MTDQDSDVLTGYEAIGKFLGWTARQAKHRALSGDLPTFKFGRTPCATKSALRAYLAKRMTQAEASVRQ
ncbi:hypothetical protein [Methylorubrum suomiense]|uniref:DNA-binding protein n=1 Tax=Methylorubrum suomiense TaxID=144191 RepID=A0ABQ4UY61_9HYPH|nr:hypothetical protein [Methylorubrum suomiense]GJE77235.1 hypothetical protein BGCPKDLD_3838 [Methylorubrum suomiense]